uniref:EF-hand domain-containing protein n=1 Tax=Ciona savignyi TaxID=51511 RepID=H2YT21_CIOSA
MDVDGDKTIDFSEFCMIIEYLQFKKGKYGDLSEAFRCLDLSNEGLALEDDVTKMLSSHAQEMSLKEINDLIRFAKSDEPDTIDYTKFVDAVKRSDCSSSNENENHEEDGLKFFETVKNSFANLKAKSADNNSSTSGSLDFDKSRKRRRNTETIDTLVRALGGPILITSAVIITANTHKKGKRWPSIQKVLRLQT